MKKKLVVLMLAVTMALAVTACGGQKGEDTQTTDKTEDTQKEDSDEIRLTVASAEDMDKYIKLGEYKGITVEKQVEEVTEDQIDAQIDSALVESAEAVTEAIQNGDIANIDYEGTLDGVAFEGGSAEGYDLRIGSGSFIEGFEEGLIGAKAGEERDLTLTFPEEYPSEELAGQETIFHVKVNEVKRIPEVTEEWVKENTGYDSVQAYRDSVKANIEASNQEYAEMTLKSTAWNQVLESSEILELPKEDVEAEKAVYNDLMEKMAKENELTLEEMIEANGMTQEDYDQMCLEYAEQMARQNLIVQAILDQEGLRFDGEEGKAALDQLLADYGMESKEDMIAQYGEMAVNESIGVTMAGDFVMNNAKIEDVLATTDGKDGVDADAEAAAAAE